MVVVGIPGVGKTTVLDAAVKKVNGSKLVTFGSVMFEEAKRLRWVKQRDEMRKMPIGKQRRLQTKAATTISRTKGSVTFVDTHLFIRTPEGFWPGLPFDVIRALKPTHLILVEAESAEILSRRKGDTTRYRDPTTQEEVQRELDLARDFLTATSLISGAPMLIVRNEEGKVDETASLIAGVLEGAAV